MLGFAKILVVQPAHPSISNEDIYGLNHLSPFVTIKKGFLWLGLVYKLRVGELEL